jgi:hypothetical protein
MERREVNMDDPTKTNEVQVMTIKLVYKGATLLVSNNGHVYDEEGVELQ